ncbi:MAG: carboxypeptidase regulatory-like domain-containing protein [Wenzhouxiangella sp.]
MPVVHHEWGHGMDANDGNPGVSRPGEGIADIFAQNMLVDSCIGRNFRPFQCTGFGDTCLSCTGVRESDWARRASGQPNDISWILRPTSSPGGGCVGVANQTGAPCGTSVHCEGSIIAEALWDLVHRDLRGFEGSAFDLDLNTALELGTRLTYLGSHVVGSWFQCNPGSGTGNGCNANGGYLNYLAADDDNGDLTDGTPHMSAIFAAFNRHGLACNTLTVQDSGCSNRPASAPQNIQAVGLDGKVALTWDPVPDAEEYWVFRSEGVKGCEFGKALVGRTSSTQFLELGLRNDFGLLYNVMAVGAQDACSGPMSPCIEAVPTAGPSGDLVGTITHLSTGELLQEVLIEAVGEVLTFETFSSAEGGYSLRLPVGSYELRASAPGFASVLIDVEIDEDQSESLDLMLDAPVITVSRDSIDMTLAENLSGETLLGLSNPSGLALEWNLFTDGARQAGQREADPALNEVLSLANFQIASAPNGGSPVVFELPAGLATRGEVLGFRFQGMVSGVSGNQTFASDICLRVEAPDGQVFGVGGYSGSAPGCKENSWEFDGTQSNNNGTYESTHPLVFDPAAPDTGNWRFTFIHDWNTSQAATMSWSDVSITLIKQPRALCLEAAEIAWLDLIDDSGSIGPGGLSLARLQVNAESLEPGRYEAGLCIASNDPLRSLLVVPVVLDLLSDVSAPVLAVSEQSLDFGEVVPGRSETRVLTLSNQGPSDALLLSLDEPLLVGDAEFDIAGGDCSPGLELAPGESCSLELRFAPSDEAGFSGTLWLISGNGQLAELALSGQGFRPDPLFRDEFSEAEDLP